MGFYDRLAATSLRLLTKFGQVAILRSKSTGGYKPGTSASAVVGEVDENRKVLPTDQPGSRIAEQYGKTLNANSLIQNGDKWCYMDGAGREPNLQDHLILDGIDYNIIDVQKTKPGPVALLYLLVLRV